MCITTDLKSLSLDVIFSKRLEMWYEALAMFAVSKTTCVCVQGQNDLVRLFFECLKGCKVQDEYPEFVVQVGDQQQLYGEEQTLMP